MRSCIAEQRQLLVLLWVARAAGDVRADPAHGWAAGQGHEVRQPSTCRTERGNRATGLTFWEPWQRREALVQPQHVVMVMVLARPHPCTHPGPMGAPVRGVPARAASKVA